MLRLFDEFDKKIINRPHNLITKKDNKGNIIGYKIECSYTPFTKDDINVEVKDNVITVKCGKENKVTEENENMEYCDIQFSLSFVESVDVSKIEAKAEDGMLRIDVPIKALEDKKSDVIKISVK